MLDFIKKYSLYGAWSVALLSMVGSLYFSNVMNLPPCVLCWYQRIAMYPLVAILAIGIIKKDKNVSLYALPLAIIGFITAIYHNLLYYNILPESIAPCTAGISCTTKLIKVFGFIDIPMLSLLGFAFIVVLLIINYKSKETL
jgi:disulfide bond formation protein DsbB